MISTLIGSVTSMAASNRSSKVNPVDFTAAVNTREPESGNRTGTLTACSELAAMVSVVSARTRLLIAKVNGIALRGTVPKL